MGAAFRITSIPVGQGGRSLLPTPPSPIGSEPWTGGYVREHCVESRHSENWRTHTLGLSAQQGLKKAGPAASECCTWANWCIVPRSLLHILTHLLLQVSHPASASMPTPLSSSPALLSTLAPACPHPSPPSLWCCSRSLTELALT